MRPPRGSRDQLTNTARSRGTDPGTTIAPMLRALRLDTAELLRAEQRRRCARPYCLVTKSTGLNFVADQLPTSVTFPSPLIFHSALNTPDIVVLWMFPLL